VELLTIQNAATAAGISVSAWIRRQLLPEPSPVPAAHIPVDSLTSQNDPLPIPQSVDSPPLALKEKKGFSTQVKNSEKNKLRHAHDELIARKNAHKLGCDCIHCERMRRMMAPSAAKV
jgi:hypothetical protein